MAELVQIGKLVQDPNEQRDAIHIAIVPLLAQDKLYPGQDIGALLVNNVYYANPHPHGNLIGIVDPFLKHPVMPGERFFLFLYPNTITSLKHNWSHPAFEEIEIDPKPVARAVDLKLKDYFVNMTPEINSVEVSKQWIRDYVDSLDSDDASYERIMEIVDQRVKGDDWDWLMWHGISNPDFDYEFWKHYAVVRGVQLSEKVKQTSFFSCSC